MKIRGTEKRMKKTTRIAPALLAVLLSMSACTNLSQLGISEFADAITNAIHATNGNIQTAIVMDTPSNGQVLTNYSFTASGFTISDSGINQVFVFVRPVGSVSAPSTYLASLQDTGSSLRPFTAAITVALNTNYNIWAQVHDHAGNVVNSSTIIVDVDASGAPPSYPEIAVYKAGTPIDSGFTFTNHFGTITRNTISTPVSITISNAGDASLIISNVSDSSSQFSNTAPQNFSIGAGGVSGFQIFYTPSTASTSYALLEIYNNDNNENPYRFVLSGSATNSTTPQPDLHVYYGGIEITSGYSYTNSFGSILTNQTTAPHTFVLSNAGTASLGISNVTDNSGQFNTGNVTTTLAAGAFTSFNVTFTPTTSGVKNGTVSIVNSFISPFTFTVSGLGTNATSNPQPEIDVYYNSTLITSGLSYTNNLGAWLTNQTSTLRTFTISNTGTATLNITYISDTSSQFTTGNLTTAIGIGQAATFNVSFNSAIAGTYHNQITIGNNDPDEAPFTFYTKASATNATGGGQLSMTIDGTKDSAWNNAFKVSQAPTVAPLNITNFYVANDNNNLYLAFEGDNPISTWNRNILVFYQIDDTLSAGTPAITEAHFAGGDTWSSSWKPTGAIFFKIASSESWIGTFAHKVNAGGTGWDNIIAGDTGNHGISTTYKFVEGKFSLSSLGLSAGKTIKFYIVLGHQFNGYSTSTLPTTYTPDTTVDDIENHTPVTWTGNYTIK